MKKSHVLIGCIFLLLLVYVGYSFWAEQQYQYFLKTPVSESRERVRFRVEKGDTATEIANNLYSKHIVIRDWVFLRYIREHKLDTEIQSGDFILFTNENIPDIVDVLTGKSVQEVIITIPEGYTVKGISELLKKKGLVKENEFLDCTEKCTFSFDFLENTKGLEGFLFPDTYYVDTASFQPVTFINRLLTTFEAQVQPYEKDITTRTFYDVLIMASLVERETKTSEERPIVAGILWKRLDNHWYLGVDATLRYYTDDWINDLTYADLQDSNPYNTYKHLGLPPTPIANPGLDSIKAAIYPTATEYWYYLHDAEGNIHYAKTNEEHVQNKLKYLHE